MQECDICVYHDYLPDYPPCSNCLSEHDISGRFPLFCEVLSEDVAFETKHTNADRIRAMSDEKLMTWIMEMQACPYELYQDCQHPNYDCETCIKGWLKQEVEG